jgi:hypothetical protein
LQARKFKKKAAAPRSARQKLQQAGRDGQALLAQRAVTTLPVDVLVAVMAEEEAARAAAAAHAAKVAQAQRRNNFRHFFPDQGTAAALPPTPPPAPTGDGCDSSEAARTVRQALQQNPDLRDLPAALALHYYPDEDPEDVLVNCTTRLPGVVEVVNTGCVAARLAHHPEELDRRAPLATRVALLLPSLPFPLRMLPLL